MNFTPHVITGGRVAPRRSRAPKQQQLSPDCAQLFEKIRLAERLEPMSVRTLHIVVDVLLRKYRERDEEGGA